MLAFRHDAAVWFSDILLLVMACRRLFAVLTLVLPELRYNLGVPLVVIFIIDRVQLVQGLQGVGYLRIPIRARNPRLRLVWFGASHKDADDDDHVKLVHRNHVAAAFAP